MSECAYTMRCRECGETHCAMVKCSERTASGPSDAPPCSPSSLTPETDEMASMRRTVTEWRTLAAKLERERDAARGAAKYAELYMRHHRSCRTQAPLSEAVAETCDCGLVETWREVRKGILAENAPAVATAPKDSD